MPAAPVVRAAPPEDVRPARSVPVRIPSPEELGVARPQASGPRVDWAAVREQLREVGGRDIQVRPVDDTYRCSLLLPGDRSGVTWRVDATASTEAEAVRLALERARQMRANP
jgi:hypothetical protein